MFLTGRNRAGRAATALAAALLVAALCACGTVNRIRGTEGASTEHEARQMAPQDPTARPIQVAWTSARASHCGFIFDPNQLRANYLAAEAQAGKTPAEMAKIERAYDYTRESVTATINRAGQVGDDPTKASYPRTNIVYYDQNTKHNVSQAIWEFLNESGPVYLSESGQVANARLSDPWFYDQLRSCDIHIVTGSGAWEKPGPSYQLSSVLSAKGIAHSLDDWGPQGGHDWPYWKHEMWEYVRKLY